VEPRAGRGALEKKQTVEFVGNFIFYNFKLGSINYSCCCAFVQVDNINKH
jgi:hypothetical protein